MNELINQNSDSALRPLVVDLDGTLIYTDMLHESVIHVLRDNPLNIFVIFIKLLRGKASVKEYLAKKSCIDPGTIPYNHKLIDWINNQKKAGREIILCTATHELIANQIAQFLKIFDAVIATDNLRNLSGQEKALKLENLFGYRGFDYVGNSHADLAVWKKASLGIAVNATSKTVDNASQFCTLKIDFNKNSCSLKDIFQMFRIHQWLKNILLFVPLVAAHQFGNWQGLILVGIAFIAFSLCATSVYITNDLLDLEYDRKHPKKYKRPFANGSIPLWIGLILCPTILALSVIASAYVNVAFMNWLTIYFLLTCAYSWKLKQLALIDCITLAILYTLRIIAGASIIQTTLSFWLLAFSFFLFLSLAFIKRYVELNLNCRDELSGSYRQEKIYGRGYISSDISIIQNLGITSGYASVIVLSLYLNSETVAKLYEFPEFLWGEVPLLLLWISWAWIKAHRNEMDDDPLIFAFKDRTSQLIGIGFVFLLTLGMTGIPWQK